MMNAVSFIRNRVAWIVMSAVLLSGASTSQAALLMKVDFNDANGNQTLANAGTISATGTAQGDFSFSSEAAPVNGGGWSASFNGTNGVLTDAVSFGDLDQLDGLSNITITAWIKPTMSDMTVRYSAGWGGFVSKYLQNEDGFLLKVRDASPDTMEALIRSSSPSAQVSVGWSTAPTDGAWQFVAFTLNDSGDVTMYRGTAASGLVANGTGSWGGLMGNSASPFRIGNGDFGGDLPFNGLIDNVRVYDEVLGLTALTKVMTESDTDLLLRMDFNENDAAAAQTLNAYNKGQVGTAQGDFSFSSEAAPVNRGGWSGSFNGTNGVLTDAVSFGDLNALDGLSNITITAWIKPTVADYALNGYANRPWAGVVSKYIGGGNGFQLFIWDGASVDPQYANYMSWNVRNTTTQMPGAYSPGATDGAWQFVALTLNDANAWVIYRGDGAALASNGSGTWAGGPMGSVSTRPFLIGNGIYVAGDLPFNGLIDNVRIYGKALSAAEIEAIMKEPDWDIPQGTVVILR